MRTRGGRRLERENAPTASLAAAVADGAASRHLSSEITVGVIGDMSAAALAAHSAAAGTSGGRYEAVAPPSRDELMLIDADLREAYKAATLLPDGRSRRGRKTKHDTATRRWIDTVGFPCVELGKRPPESDMAMLKLSPRSSLSGANLIARDACSQLHGRDPRSKQQTPAEQAGQQTLLAWARTNLPLEPATVRRGRVSSWRLNFGRFQGFTPRQLAMSGAVGGSALPTQQAGPPPGAYLLWPAHAQQQAGFQVEFISQFITVSRVLLLVSHGSTRPVRCRVP